jgi:hypothetical protein
MVDSASSNDLQAFQQFVDCDHVIDLFTKNQLVRHHITKEGDYQADLENKEDWVERGSGWSTLNRYPSHPSRTINYDQDRDGSSYKVIFYFWLTMVMNLHFVFTWCLPLIS